MNQQKFLSYQEAWARIRDALEADFPFEAVTILESILSDRLLSYLSAVEADRQLTVRTSFGELIRLWSRAAERDGDSEAVELARQVDLWRVARNSVVHGLAKSEPGAPTEEVVGFVDRARRAAEEGAKLARAVDAWHKTQLRRSKAEVRP